MCIILTCEQGIRPDYSLIEDCFYSNPDGAGIMWCGDGMVQTSKGYTDPQSLFTAIESTPKHSRLVIHMRIATSGGIDVGTCHPFPVSRDLEMLHAADTECHIAIAHNGIICGMPTDKDKGISDTVAFVGTYVNTLWEENNHVVTKSMRRRIKEAAPGNRFAIMTSDGKVYRLGVGWETVTKGIHASNDTWRWKPVYWAYNSKSKSKGNSYWDRYDDYYSDDWGYYKRYYQDEPLYDEGFKPVFDMCCQGCADIGTCMAYGAACPLVQDALDAFEEELYWKSHDEKWEKELSLI